MAYQNVGNPRFYISYGDWWKALGVDVPVWHTISPYETSTFTLVEGSGQFPNYYYTFPQTWMIYDIGYDNPFVPSSWDGMNWAGCLNHNLKTGLRFIVKQYTTQGDNYFDSGTAGVNCPIETSGFSLFRRATPWSAAYTGWSGVLQAGVASIDATVTAAEAGEYKVGCIIYGKHYEMPHSPDLSLKMSIEMDGVKNIKTKGGASLPAIDYREPQDWGYKISSGGTSRVGAWQLAGAANLRNGRRVWDLSFSYLSDSGIMPQNMSANSYGHSSSTNPNDAYSGEHLTNDTSFYGQVLTKTMGGHLPFIFQPDGNNDNPDQFAICRFDMNTFTYEQVANNVYNVKLKIREVW